MSHTSSRRGMLIGLVSGLVAALVMDAITPPMLVLFGERADAGFALIGDTLAACLSEAGLELPGGVPLGLVLHYTVSLLLGALFGSGAARIRAVRLASPVRVGALGALYTELISLPLLFLPPLMVPGTPAGV